MTPPSPLAVVSNGTAASGGNTPTYRTMFNIITTALSRLTLHILLWMHPHARRAAQRRINRLTRLRPMPTSNDAPPDLWRLTHDSGQTSSMILPMILIAATLNRDDSGRYASLLDGVMQRTAPPLPLLREYRDHFNDDDHIFAPTFSAFRSSITGWLLCTLSVALVLGVSAYGAWRDGATARAVSDLLAIALLSLFTLYADTYEKLVGNMAVSMYASAYIRGRSKQATFVDYPDSDTNTPATNTPATNTPEPDNTLVFVMPMPKPAKGGTVRLMN